MIPFLVNNEATVRRLIDLLYSPKRKVPVIVITQRTDKQGPVIRGPKLQELLGPMGKVFTVSGGIQRTFNRLLDNFFGIEPAGVRMYMPRMSTNDYPTKHPVWNQTKIEAFETPEDFMNVLHGLCVKRLEYQKTHTHTQKLISIEQADAMLQQALSSRPKLSPTKPVVIERKHPTRGRAVLHPCVPPTKRDRPSDDAIIALMRKFKK